MKIKVTRPTAVAIVVCALLWAAAFPWLNGIINQTRLMPGVGGEALLPVIPIAAVWLWGHRHDLDGEEE